MTCAQGLLRLLWAGGAEVGVLRDCIKYNIHFIDNARKKLIQYFMLCFI